MTEVHSPPPCGEGSGVGVSKHSFLCGTPTPHPSPQGGGEKKLARNDGDYDAAARFAFFAAAVIAKPS
jgi:hypothetical protein